MSIVLGTSTVFTTIGVVTIRPVNIEQDTERIHAWVTNPRSKFWGALASTTSQVQEEYRRIALSPHETASILELDGAPVAICEIYDPTYAVLNNCSLINHEYGDVGLHFLVSPPSGAPIHNLTSTLFSALIRWIFTHAGVQRILVEPDEANHAILRLNARAGFRQPGLRVALQTHTGVKNAVVQECRRVDFDNSEIANLSYISSSTISDSNSITAKQSSAEDIHRELIAKTLREFTHERIITPQEIASGILVDEVPFDMDDTKESRYEVVIGDMALRFSGRLYGLLHLQVDPKSIHLKDKTEWQPDILDLFAKAYQDFNIPPQHLHTYLNELSSTYAARIRSTSVSRPLVSTLTDPQRDPVESFLAIESAMTEGHPGFVANTGRTGLGEQQAHEWSPELGRSTQLVWCGALKECSIATTSTFTTLEDSINTYAPWFDKAMREVGLDPSDYVPIAFHPWQWEHYITSAFSTDVTSGRLVYLGRGTDLYRPTQSLRTFFNASRPESPYIKTAVGIRNMGFTRGLSANYMKSTPAVSDWIRLTVTDDELTSRGVGFLSEFATCSYMGDAYHTSAKNSELSDSAYLKMTSVLLRQSPFARDVHPPLQDNESLSTMAALLYRDPLGDSMVSAWISLSGLSPVAWLDSLLEVYLRPLVHLLLRYKLVLMPHTENVILRVNRGRPVGVYHKDLGEEAAVLSRTVPLPEHLNRLFADVGESESEAYAQQALSIHTDVVDGVLRHLAVLMIEDGLITQPLFWQRVRHCLGSYATDHPEVADSGLWHALHAPRFRHSTLNRLQLRNPQTMVDISDQESSLIYAGSLANPLAYSDISGT